MPWEAPPSVKLHTVFVPVALATVTAQLFKFVTALCSERKAKFSPTVCSTPPTGVTKTEYIWAGMSTTNRKLYFTLAA